MRPLITRAAATIVAAAGLVLPAPSPSAAPVALGTVPEQCVTLRQMGVSDITVARPAGTRDLRTISFTLPAGAAQGPSSWYLIKLHASVVRAAGSSGSVLVTAATDGQTGAQIEYILNPDGMTWSTVSAAEPGQNGHTSGRTADVQMTNYLQNAGIRSGLNTLTFRVELDNGARLDAVTVHNDTCIQRTGTSPEQVKVTAAVLSTSVAPGGSVTVRVRVTNTGNRPLRQVFVTATPGDGGMVATSPARQATTNLTGTWTGDFRFTAGAVGQHPVLVRVGTAISATISGSTVVIPVAHNGLSRFAGIGAGVVFAAIAAALIWFVLVGRRPRRRPSRR